MPINCLVNSEQIVNNSCSNNQFMVNSWTIHEHSCFKKTALSSFALRLFHSVPLSSSLFLSFPLSSSLRLFVFLSFCLFVSSSPFLSFPLFSSLRLFVSLSLPLLLSFFNAHSAKPANSLKTKELRKRHFWLQIFESRETAKIQNVRCKIGQWFTHFPSDPTLHTPPETDPTCSDAKPYIM